MHRPSRPACASARVLDCIVFPPVGLRQLRAAILAACRPGCRGPACLGPLAAAAETRATTDRGCSLGHALAVTARRARARVAVPAGMETVMVSGISPVLDSGTRAQWLSSVPSSTATTFISPGPWRPEASYHPQLQPPGPSATGAHPSQAGSPYAIPAGQTLADVASGTRAQPFDVTLSQLATAVYGTRGAPPAGWSAVSAQQLQQLGVAAPLAWRLQYLGANDSVPTNAQEFRAEIYTDGAGNYVLSYRGTAEGADDWDNNFRQGLGYETRDGDKFSGTAVN